MKLLGFSLFKEYKNDNAVYLRENSTGHSIILGPPATVFLLLIAVSYHNIIVLK